MAVSGSIATVPSLTAAPTTLGSAALASPYDGTNPSLTGLPMNGMVGAPGATTLPGAGMLSGGRPQLNATNQTALAPNGNVNQTVTNSNQYVNKYYNIIVPHGGLFGSIGGVGGLFGGGIGTPGNSFIDPKTGVLYVQQETGFVGWLKRLFRGY